MCSITNESKTITFNKVCSGFYKSNCGTIEISKTENNDWVIEKYNSVNCVEWYDSFRTKAECVEMAKNA